MARGRQRRRSQRFANGEGALDAARLEHDPDSLPKRALTLPRVEAQHADLAAAARPVTLEDLDGGGLAGAVRSEQPEHLAPGDLEVDTGDRFGRSVGLPQAPHEHRRTARVPCHGHLSHGIEAALTSPS